MTYTELVTDFENGGVLFSILGGVINTVGGLIFAVIKPQILSIISGDGIPQANAQLKQLSYQFPNSIPIVDAAFAQLRIEAVPKDLPLEDLTVGQTVQLKLTDGQLTGLQSIHRSGPLSVEYSNHTIHLVLQVSPKKSQGHSK